MSFPLVWLQCTIMVPPKTPGVVGEKLTVTTWDPPAATMPLTRLHPFPPRATTMASRTWVSGVGDDANPGTRTAPCKTFAGAISKTDAGGEIDVLDPGGFGALTITKAVTVDGAGTFASVLASGTAGINVAAGANDVVTLRNLSIHGFGSTLDGIHFTSGAALHLENCTIFNCSRRAVNFTPAATSRLFIKDCVFRHQADAANGGAVLVSPQPTGSALVSVDATRNRV